MNRTLLSTIALLVVCAGGQAQATPASTSAGLIEVRRIWDQAEHSAFTDLIRFRARWFCCFRESDRHVYGKDGRIRIITSQDGESWESTALLSEDGVDLRDPKLSVTPDGRLMLLCGGSVYEDRTLVKRQPRVTFSSDGDRWTGLQPVLSPGDWLWRVTWHNDTAWGVSYRLAETGDWTVTLYRSEDGIDYQQVCELDVPGKPNETTLRFDEDDRMIALVRREGDDAKAWIGTASPPYAEWKWSPTDWQVGGPEFIILPDGGMWAAGRRYPGGARTVLARMTRDSYEPVLTLPSGGDTSYPGLVWHDGMLWMSYYSSHEKRTAIYLARIKLPKR